MSILKRFFNFTSVEERDGGITVKGLRAQTFYRDILKVWQTSKINTYLFKRMTADLFSFNPFFAVDVVYMMRELLTHRKTWSDRSKLQELIQLLEENTWLKNTKTDHPSKLNRSRLSHFHKTPLPHQTEFFEIYDRNTQAYMLKGYLLSAPAGSGKTLTSLMLAEMLNTDHVIAVVPNNSVYTVWADTIKHEFKTPQTYWVAGEGKAYNNERFLISHYEGLEKLLEAARGLKGTTFIVLDESHFMNTSGSLRSQRFVELCSVTNSQDIIWSSGTPIKALGQEVIPLLRSIDSLFDADAEERFRQIFGMTSSRALDILRNRIGLISYRIDKKTVVDNAISTITHKVKLDNGERYTTPAIKKEMGDYVVERLKYYEKNMSQYERFYRECLQLHRQTLTTPQQIMAYETYVRYIEDIRRFYDPSAMQIEAMYCNEYEQKTIMPSLPQDKRKEFKDTRSVIKYVHLKVFGEALGRILGKRREELHVEMVKVAQLEQFVETAAKKTLIFTSYVAVVRQLGAYFDALGYQSILVYGDTNHELDIMVNQLRTNEKVNPAVATFKSLSTAVPMTMASTAIFINQPFRDHEKIQAQARLDRIGQDSAITFVDVVLDTGDVGNLSTRAAEILEWSKSQVAAIMGSSYGQEVDKTLDKYYVSKEAFALDEYYVDGENTFDVTFESVVDELFAMD